MEWTLHRRFELTLQDFECADFHKVRQASELCDQNLADELRYHGPGARSRYRAVRQAAILLAGRGRWTDHDEICEGKGKVSLPLLPFPLVNERSYVPAQSRCQGPIPGSRNFRCRSRQTYAAPACPE